MVDNAVFSAIVWISSILLGTIATSVGLLAVAVVGLAMMQGRIPLRRGVGVVLGCFVLFSASTIANGLINGAATPIEVAEAPPAPVAAYRPTVPAPTPYDPYAGASVPFTQAPPQGGLLK